MSDFVFPDTNLKWLQKRTIFLTKHGSTAYGTALPTSDVDVRGVAVPPLEYYLGYAKRFEQAQFKEPDMVVYEVQKFFKLCADCNPNCLEILYTDPQHHFVTTVYGNLLLKNRDLFLSKKARHTFSGYAMSQLKRLKHHHRWLRDPPKGEPTRKEFDLPPTTLIPKEQLEAVYADIRKVVERWDVAIPGADDASIIDLKNRYAEALAEQKITSDSQWEAAARTLGINDNFIYLMGQERKFQTAVNEWRQYGTWKQERNEARAELEAKFGYDTKHGMHLVRLLRMGREVLAGEGVKVFRPDREELLAIRAGAWSFEQLIDWAEKADADLDAAYQASALPRVPQHERLDILCQHIVGLASGL